MTFYTLQLVPGEPTRYLYNGQARPMSSRELTIPVLQPDGSLKSVTRTFYSSHYGPILSLPGIGWSDKLAITYRDANADNTAFLTQYLRMGEARNLQQFQDSLAQVQGIAWVNTLATDRDGNTLYVNASSTPNLGPDALQRWQRAIAGGEPLTTRLFQDVGVVLLDGSDPANEWVAEPGARSPGLIPYARAPRLSRRDFVLNANDSHWRANPNAPLEGFSPLYGLERRPQSPRTRMNALMLMESREGGASGADGRFTLPELQDALFNNRSLMAELLREQVVQRYQGKSTATAGGQSVDITRACALLAGWQGRFDTDSVGAVLWREFIGAFPRDQLLDAGALFRTPFSPLDPIAAPNTLQEAPATGEDPVLGKLAQPVLNLGAAGIPLDKSLGDVQFRPQGDQRIPLHGGLQQEGVINIVGYSLLSSSLAAAPPRGTVLNPNTGLSTSGYPVNFGTSFTMVVEFTDDGVKGAALLTHGESDDPSSPRFGEQTALFSAKQWREISFSIQEVMNEPDVTVVFIQGE